MRHIGETSTETTIIAELLASAAVGDVITYQSINEAAGCNVQNGSRQMLNAARRRVQKEKQIVFGTVRGVGLQRLDDTGIVDTADSTRAHMRRTAHRAVKRLSCVDFDDMPAEARTKHNVSMSYFGVVHAMSKESGIKKIEDKVQTTAKRLSIGDTLAAFGG